MPITQYFTLGLLLSQVWSKSRETQGATLKAMHTAIDTGFFAAFQTVEIPFEDERKAIAVLLEGKNFPYTYCLARVMNDNKLNLSDIDEPNRQRSVETIISKLQHAKQAGATAVTLISGPAPLQSEHRGHALAQLELSMAAICAAAQKIGGLRIVIEPLDYAAHKKNTLGTTAEAVALVQALEYKGLALGLCIDSAHLYLNSEDPLKAASQAGQYMDEFHFCNCVIDRANPLYGDYHMRFGLPGVLDVQGMGRIMKGFVQQGVSAVRPLPVYCEVIAQSDDDPMELLQYNQDMLKQTWQVANELLKKEGE